MQKIQSILLILTLSLMAGCAGTHMSPPAAPVPAPQVAENRDVVADPDADVPEDAAAAEAGDPYEAMNRHFYNMNQRMDRNLLRPVAEAYIGYVPSPVRTGVHNLLTLANLPVVFANDVLQARPNAAGQTLTRLVVNVVFGLGVCDAASDFGIPSHGNDFGRTLGVWGWRDPPYLMLPLLGPTSPRDVIGFAGTIALDPAIIVQYPYFAWVLTGRKAAEVVDTRAGLLPFLDKMKAQSMDPYATMRSIYMQHRRQQIRDAGGDSKP